MLPPRPMCTAETSWSRAPSALSVPETGPRLDQGISQGSSLQAGGWFPRCRISAVNTGERFFWSSYLQFWNNPTFQPGAGTGANLWTLVATEDRGQARKRSVGHSSVLSSSDKSGNEGRKPRMPCGVWGRIDIIAAFPGPGRTLCLGIFFLRKSQSSHHINTRQH